jgi:hypothetical protein
LALAMRESLASQAPARPEAFSAIARELIALLV